MLTGGEGMYGLSENNFQILMDNLTKYKNDIAWVKIFGSRARSDFRTTSDIDLAISFRKNIINTLQEELYNSKLPYKVDLIDYDTQNNLQLKQYIDQEGQLLFITNEKGELKMTDAKLQDKLCDYKKALNKLQAALEKDPIQDDLYLDGTIQRFEFSYELAWKLVKHYLAYEGIEANSPRSSIREGFQAGIIRDPELWLDMLEKRNMTSHTYNEMTAQEIYQHIKMKYIDLLVDLAKVIDDKI